MPVAVKLLNIFDGTFDFSERRQHLASSGGKGAHTTPTHTHIYYIYIYCIPTYSPRNMMSSIFTFDTELAKLCLVWNYCYLTPDNLMDARVWTTGGHGHLVMTSHSLLRYRSHFATCLAPRAIWTVSCYVIEHSSPTSVGVTWLL